MVSPFFRGSATLKWAVRTILGVLALTIVVFIWHVFAGTVGERLTSPDKRVVAEVRNYTFRPATEAVETAVQVGYRFHLGNRHTIFDGLNYGAEIKISWIDPRTLLVRCVPCNSFRILVKEQRWGPVSIQYEID